MGENNGGNNIPGGLNQNTDSVNGVRGAVGGPIGANGDGEYGANNLVQENGGFDNRSNGRDDSSNNRSQLLSGVNGENSSNNRSQLLSGVNGENGDNRRLMDDSSNNRSQLLSGVNGENGNNRRLIDDSSNNRSQLLSGVNGENGDNRRLMDDNIKSRSSVHERQFNGFNNLPSIRDDDIRSSVLNNNNRSYDGFNRTIDENYNRSNERGYNRSNERGYEGGARPKTYQDYYTRSNEQPPPRLSIFEDNPRQKQYIFHDEPRQRQSFFEETRYRSNEYETRQRQDGFEDRHRSNAYDERYRGERQDYMDRTREGRNTIPIPILEEFSEFNTWKECIIAWSETTELPKYKQGYFLASELPAHSDRYGKHLKEDLFRACPPSTLINNTNGVQKVVDFLRTRIYIDEEKEIFEVKRQMSKIERKPNQNINDYIIEFETLRERSKQLGIEIQNDRLLALTIFECAKLDITEETVLRGVCQFMTKDGNRYETVKRKLREVCSRLHENQSKNNEELFCSQNSNREDDIQNNVDQVYLSRGWKPPTQNQRYQNRGNQNNRYQNNQNRTNQHNRSNNNNNNNAQQVHFRTRAKNPIGPDGKIMTCNVCKAETHLQINCPDSYENRRKAGKGGNNNNRKFKTVYMCNEQNGEEKEFLMPFSDSESEKESVNCTVLCSDNKEEMSNFTAEALNMAALDTCCTSSVAGEEWLKIYKNSLPEDLKSKLQGPIESKKQFVFGNQGKLKSKAKYIIPVKIGGVYNEISIDIIRSDIPLLLSKAEMKKLGITLDMRNDQGTINGKPLVLTTTTAGHYIVDLLQESEMLETVNIAELEEDNDKEQEKALAKLHLQFGHRPKKVFVTILKEAGKWQEKFSEMIDSIMDKCEGCLLRKRTPDRPAVAPPMANDFGQVLTIDLKVWDMKKGIYIMYMIDLFTRFQVAAVIRSKEPQEIVKTLLLKWMPIFGRVEKILTDNGTEFCNEEMREVASSFNIQLLTTGANAPWQNGMNENNHGLTDSITRSNLRDYPSMSLEVALAWAVSAVNSLTNVRGFSPYQLVFGKQIKLPNILDDPPPAWEEPTKSKALIDTLNALHNARVEYTKAERCERIRKALRAKIRVADTVYENGDIVYFKKEGEDAWRGPAKVVFQDSKVIFIRIGSIYYRVSANRLIKASDALVKELKERDSKDESDTVRDHRMNEKKDTTETSAEHNTRSRQKQLDKILDEQEKDRHGDNNTTEDHTATDKDQSADKQRTAEKRSEVQATRNDDKTVTSNEIEPASENDKETTEKESTDSTEKENTSVAEKDKVINTEEKSTEVTSTEKEKDKIPLRSSKGTKRRKTSQKPSPSFNDDGTLQNASNVLKRNDRIEILEKGKWEKGKILSHGGKIGGRNAGWFNIELDNGEVFHDEVSKREIRYENNTDLIAEEEEVLTVIKLDNGRNMEITDVDNRKIRIEKEEETAFLMICEEILAVMVPQEKRNSPECQQAKQDELNKLKAFDTYDIVDDIGQERITTTWVLTEKGSEVRARLTARGFQEDTDFPTDSPTVQKQSIRLISVFAATEKWTIHTTDISSAFLQGSKMDREVFVKPPKEAGLENKLYRLNKCLYGLKDASRKWYMRLQTKLKELGFTKSPLDKGLFYLIKDGILIGVVGIHVDDFFYAGTDEFIEKVMPQILGIFKVGKSESSEFMYTGFMFRQDKEGITIDQNKYIENVNVPQVNVRSFTDKKREMTHDELSMLRQITGVLNWTVRATRPDLAYDCIDLSTHFKGGSVEELIKAHNCANRMKKNKVSVRISDLGNLNHCQIWMYSDAAFRNLNDKVDSCGGFVIFLVNIRDGRTAVIEWKSNKLKRKVLSTLGAETQALSLGLDAALGVKTQIKEMTNGKIDLAIRAITDNKSARDAIYSESVVEERMLRPEIAIIKDMIEDGRVLEVRWIEGKEMLADLLTKKGVNKIPLLDVIQSGRMPQKTLDLILK